MKEIKEIVKVLSNEIGLLPLSEQDLTQGKLLELLNKLNERGNLATELMYSIEYFLTDVRPSDENTKRIVAVKWWKSLPSLSFLSPKSKSALAVKYFGENRRYASLTSREIELVYDAENNKVI